MLQPSQTELRRLAEAFQTIERGLVVCGPGPGIPSPNAVTALAGKLGWPVLADCLSGVRCGPHDREFVVDNYDAFIGTARAAAFQPEAVLRFGAVPVSKPLVQFLERHRDARQVFISGGAGRRDPGHLASESWDVDATAFCEGLTGTIENGRKPGDWVEEWRTAAAAAREAAARELEGFDGLFEGAVFAGLAELLPEGSILCAGNSMPVRDLDTFFPASDKAITFHANRGASGIDGVTSTALGTAAAAGKRVTLVTGDISFHHDLNGLLAARKFGLDATVIVLNNDGGGIFSFLPQAGYDDVFEPYFGTPHGLTFESAAALYGLGYARAADRASFEAAVRESAARPGTTIIEVPGDRKQNAARHRQVREAVAKALGGGNG